MGQRAEALIGALSEALDRADTSQTAMGRLGTEVRNHVETMDEMVRAWHERTDALAALEGRARQGIDVTRRVATAQNSLLGRQRALEATSAELLDAGQASHRDAAALRDAAADALANANRQLRIGEVTRAETRALGVEVHGAVTAAQQSLVEAEAFSDDEEYFNFYQLAKQVHASAKT